MSNRWCVFSSILRGVTYYCFIKKLFFLGIVRRFDVIKQYLDTDALTFKAHNIEIPYPQRDLHVKSLDINTLKNLSDG